MNVLFMKKHINIFCPSNFITAGEIHFTPVITGLKKETILIFSISIL